MSEENESTYAQSKALKKRDLYWFERGIKHGLWAAVSGEKPDLRKDRIDQVYRNHLNLNRKNGIKL